MIYEVKGISRYVWGMRGCLWVCAGVRKCTYMYMGGCGCAGVCGSVRNCSGVCKCVLDEFSEYLLETRVNTSADFNTYPIQIFNNFSK